MSFLNPFLIDRETSSNVPRQTLPPFAWQANPATLVPEEESQESQPGGSQPASQPASQLASPPASQPANSQQAEEGETGQEEASVAFRGKRKRGREMYSFEQSLLLEDDEDLLFFKSLLPTMILMSRAKRLRVRFAIHKVVLDADQEEN
ncbi:hypothetical protein NQZ68_040427 [Dissostichus eleginoides]|nr:hypothetical protein NQZ68_040427 [Dissostichus eleginoides]